MKYPAFIALFAVCAASVGWTFWRVIGNPFANAVNFSVFAFLGFFWAFTTLIPFILALSDRFVTTRPADIDGPLDLYSPGANE